MRCLSGILIILSRLFLRNERLRENVDSLPNCLKACRGGPAPEGRCHTGHVSNMNHTADPGSQRGPFAQSPLCGPLLRTTQQTFADHTFASPLPHPLKPTPSSASPQLRRPVGLHAGLSEGPCTYGAPICTCVIKFPHFPCNLSRVNVIIKTSQKNFKR